MHWHLVGSYFGKSVFVTPLGFWAVDARMPPRNKAGSDLDSVLVVGEGHGYFYSHNCSSRSFAPAHRGPVATRRYVIPSGEVALNIDSALASGG
jgi:hypothetical protein